MPDEPSASRMRFEIFKSLTSEAVSARVGRLHVLRRRPIDTPNIFPITSRGVVPHLTPDTLTRHGSWTGFYLAMEDLMQLYQSKTTSTPPILSQPLSPLSPSLSRLHAFTALPTTSPVLLAPRRLPAVKMTQGNGKDYITIFTSNGTRLLSITEYNHIITQLAPDIVVPMADIYHGTGETTKQGKMQQRQVDRSDEWIAEFARTFGEGKLREFGVGVFMPTLTVPYTVQWDYLARLEEVAEDGGVDGLAVYDVNILPDLGKYERLARVPRMSLDPARGPHEVLRQVEMGVDLFLLPFVNEASEMGVALTFEFPAPARGQDEEGEVLPLGFDLTDAEHATSLKPFVEGCTCYACAAHHRAFVHHLLDAHEMLAWTLLQIHNYHVVNHFFEGIRSCLVADEASTDGRASDQTSFDEECQRFTLAYEPEVPAGGGQKPRARGYHFKSLGGDEKRNKAAWRTEYTDTAKGDGVAEAPLVPSEDAGELAEKGFAVVKGPS